MTLFRVALIALMVAALAVAPYLVPTTGLASAVSSAAYAAPSAGLMAQDNDDDDNDNRRDDNDNRNNDNDGDENDNRRDDNDNEEDGGILVAPAPAPAAPAPPPAPACSTPGQEMTFQSDDGRVAVRVFATMPQSVRVRVLLPVDPSAVPPAPGQVVGGLIFQLVAETCDGSPIPTFASEVNLGVHYSDADAAGLNEAAFTLARLDTSANQWRPAEKQAADPPANYTSATIRDLGYYVLYQRP